MMEQREMKLCYGAKTYQVDIDRKWHTMEGKGIKLENFNPLHEIVIQLG